MQFNSLTVAVFGESACCELGEHPSYDSASALRSIRVNAQTTTLASTTRPDPVSAQTHCTAHALTHRKAMRSSTATPTPICARSVLAMARRRIVYIAVHQASSAASPTAAMRRWSNTHANKCATKREMRSSPSNYRTSLSQHFLSAEICLQSSQSPSLQSSAQYSSLYSCVTCTNVAGCINGVVHDKRRNVVTKASRRRCFTCKRFLFYSITRRTASVKSCAEASSTCALAKQQRVCVCAMFPLGMVFSVRVHVHQSLLRLQHVKPLLPTLHCRRHVCRDTARYRTLSTTRTETR
jgi:hypothetical protein